MAAPISAKIDVQRISCGEKTDTSTSLRNKTAERSPNCSSLEKALRRLRVKACDSGPRKSSREEGRTCRDMSSSFPTKRKRFSSSSCERRTMRGVRRRRNSWPRCMVNVDELTTDIVSHGLGRMVISAAAKKSGTGTTVAKRPGNGESSDTFSRSYWMPNSRKLHGTIRPARLRFPLTAKTKESIIKPAKLTISNADEKTGAITLDTDFASISRLRKLPDFRTISAAASDDASENVAAFSAELGKIREHSTSEDDDEILSSPKQSKCGPELTAGCVAGGEKEKRRPSPLTCAEQARGSGDVTVDELAAYLDNSVYIPKKMSKWAEAMYT